MWHKDINITYSNFILLHTTSTEGPHFNVNWKINKLSSNTSSLWIDWLTVMNTKKSRQIFIEIFKVKEKNQKIKVMQRKLRTKNGNNLLRKVWKDQKKN